MAKYLTQERRQIVADEINSAILRSLLIVNTTANVETLTLSLSNIDRAGSPPISYLELYVRYNTVIWNYMNEHDVRVAPSRGWPTGVALPVRPQPILASAPAGVKMPRRDDPEVCDLFPRVFSTLMPLSGGTPFQLGSIFINLTRRHWSPITLPSNRNTRTCKPHATHQDSINIVIDTLALFCSSHALYLPQTSVSLLDNPHSSCISSNFLSRMTATTLLS